MILIRTKTQLYCRVFYPKTSPVALIELFCINGRNHTCANTSGIRHQALGVRHSTQLVVSFKPSALEHTVVGFACFMLFASWHKVLIWA